MQAEAVRTVQQSGPGDRIHTRGMACRGGVFHSRRRFFRYLPGLKELLRNR